MKRILLIFLLSILFMGLAAQTSEDKFIGEWKSYLGDSTTFELLKLNHDQTGIKCFGKTINGRDTLFTNHVTFLVITSWNLNKRSLTLKTRNTVSFQLNPVYKIKWVGSGQLELTGEHLQLHLFPSVLNREYFQRTVTYQPAEATQRMLGVKSSPCIIGQKLFTFHPIDSATHLAEYKGFEDLIPYIIGCQTEYEFIQFYKDPAYTLQIPSSLRKWSYGFGDKHFYISFDSEKPDSSETSIAVYYDFGNQDKEYFFSQLKQGKEKKDLITIDGKEIYKSINWQGKYSGKVFLQNFIYVAYYTRDIKMVPLLQKSIISFKYR